MKEQIGPSVETKIIYRCSGCKFLKTEEWDYLCEDDEIDSGTDAHCEAMQNKHIDSYWYESNKAPDWCPYLPKEQ